MMPKHRRQGGDRSGMPLTPLRWPRSHGRPAPRLEPRLTLLPCRADVRAVADATVVPCRVDAGAVADPRRRPDRARAMAAAIIAPVGIQRHARAAARKKIGWGGWVFFRSGG
ncbi:hypothetical protein E2562_005840 [Oryza meyeriana var. granulata]|uniref:Uncharacterized protein n=1 Tax=Oryza meyeriana var. granulata TaxID=110450 RepID=A0A6G1CDM7_9ORYZ|nr:hypothetical protein E2562_005840 [Oryza meyeriana var. granulata]